MSLDDAITMIRKLHFELGDVLVVEVADGAGVFIRNGEGDLDIHGLSEPECRRLLDVLKKRLGA